MSELQAREITLQVKVRVRGFHRSEWRKRALVAAAYLLLQRAGAAEVPIAASELVLEDRPWVA